MAEKLRIIPLGGLDEIGKNITVLEYGKDMIVVDCGVGFPDDDMYGVDAAILMNQKVWQASGHVDTFVDPLCEDTVRWGGAHSR